eukprot:4708072-Lingulodinium_polyedra.AAC.1
MQRNAQRPRAPARQNPAAELYAAPRDITNRRATATGSRLTNTNPRGITRRRRGATANGAGLSR